MDSNLLNGTRNFYEMGLRKWLITDKQAVFTRIYIYSVKIWPSLGLAFANPIWPRCGKKM